jgi:hypothetical protein
MKSLGRRELLKTLATISCASTVTTQAHGRAMKSVNAPPACNGNVLNVIIHGMFAITADDQNITLVMPKVAGHYYAAGTFGLERPLMSNAPAPLHYTLTVPGWKPVAPAISDKTDIVVHRKDSFHFDSDPFCYITMPATNEIFRVSVSGKGKRHIFEQSTSVASEPDLIPLVYVFQYTYSGGMPSMGALWQADSAGDGAGNLHLWAAPPFLGDHAHAQGAMEAFNDLFDPKLDLKLTQDDFGAPVTNIQCCGVSPQEVWSIPEARLHTVQRESESRSSMFASPFRKSEGLSSMFIGHVGKSAAVAPMFGGHVRTCWTIWILS